MYIERYQEGDDIWVNGRMYFKILLEHILKPCEGKAVSRRNEHHCI